MAKLNLVFAGTPQFAANILKHLLDYIKSPSNNIFNLAAVYSQPDRKSGRGRKLTPTPVKQVLLDHNIQIPLEQPLNFKNQADIDILKQYKPDIIIVVAYGLILPQAVLDIPTHGCINIHASLLPRWRGAAPIQRAIETGDDRTGITIQQMERSLDTGPVISESICEISNTDTTPSLTHKLLELAKPLLIKTITNIADNNFNLIPQDSSKATYAKKLDKLESQINWQSSSIDINRKIRAFEPWPGTVSNISSNTIKIISVETACSSTNNNSGATPGTIISNSNNKLIIQTGDGPLTVTKIQFSGGKPINIKDALNGKYKNLLQPGVRFT